MDLHNLKATAEEQDLLSWCYANLTEEQAAEVEDEAIEAASVEINAPKAAELLATLLMKIIVRNARQECKGGCNSPSLRHDEAAVR